jgi:hypothetical protein
MDNPIAGSPVAQIAFVFKDIEAAKLKFASMLGLPVPNTIYTEPGSVVNADHRGIPTDAKAKLAFFQLPNVQIELIEPISDDSAWAEGLIQNGEGFHHIAFWTENATAVDAHLKAEGMDRMQRGDMGDGQYVYYDGRPDHGLIVEVLEKVRTPLS